jgi:hypothetical protein
MVVPGAGCTCLGSEDAGRRMRGDDAALRDMSAGRRRTRAIQED